MDMKQRIAKLNTSVAKPPLNPHQAPFLKKASSNHFPPTTFHFFSSFPLSNHNKAQKGVNWYHARNDPLIYLKQKQCTDWNLNIFPIVQSCSL